RAISTPINTPTMVVMAKPFRAPKPMTTRGDIAMIVVAAAAKIMLKARAILER
ncbi:MAG: hypothetical protein AWU58_1214, partial [Methanohalophilus sp. T328-1]